MTDISMEEPRILEKLSDLEDQAEYLAQFTDIRGRAVVNPKGDQVGSVDDLYVNPRDRQVQMAAITFWGSVGTGGRTVLVPIEELRVSDEDVHIVTHEDRLRLAPEFHEGAPIYESHYEYWSSQAADELDDLSEGVVPPGRLALAEDEENL